MSYASDTTDSYRIVGEYTGRILKGEKAGDLPIQQPTTARALGLTVPTSMFILADEIIE